MMSISVLDIPRQYHLWDLTASCPIHKLFKILADSRDCKIRSHTWTALKPPLRYEGRIRIARQCFANDFYAVVYSGQRARA
jgi:hypothetical protein